MAVITVTEISIRQQADPSSYERGRSYAAAGRVRRLSIDGTIVRATVDGPRPYQVALEVTSAGISAECTCPYGEDGCSANPASPPRSPG